MEKNMKISGKKPWYVEYLLIVIGTGLMGFAITSAFDAAGLVTGGFSGVAIIVKAWTESFLEGGIPLWMTNFCLNVPVFLLGIKIRGFAFAKKAFIGCSGISAQAGVTTEIANEVNVNQLMIEHATQEVYVLADHTKIGLSSSFTSCSIDRVKHLITDEKAPADELELMKAQNVDVYQVKKAQ